MLHESLQPLLAPVVLISACGLLVMALNARMMTAKARIREFHHERLEICVKAGETGAATITQKRRYEGVGVQSEVMLRRLRLIQISLMWMVGCVVLMLASSLLIGLDSLESESVFDGAAVATFVAGVLSMLAGAVTFLFEVGISLREVRYEHHRIMDLTLPSAEQAPTPRGAATQSSKS